MLHFSWRQIGCLFILVILAIGPIRSHAADGVVLFDQDRAMAGNVTSGDAPGFPVTISQPGSYRLSGNLTVNDADTTVIQITADSVTLDLNGFSIIGPAVCTPGPATTCLAAGKGIGVQVGGNAIRGPRGVRILNGSIRGMGQGIQMMGDGSFVERINTDSNSGGGMSVSGTVIQSAATHNGSFGIIATTVRDSTVLQNLGDGIILDVGGGVASGNVSSFNGGFGIYVPYGTATGNTLFLNKSTGISALCPSSIVGNTVVANDSRSIETNREGCVLADNATRP
jgi:hypothetical protein